MLIQAAPVPVTTLQERSLDMLAITTPTQLYQRDEPQLNARGDIFEWAKTVGMKELKITDNVALTNAGSSHLDHTPISRKLEEEAAWYRYLRRLFADANKVILRQRSAHQELWDESDVWDAERVRSIRTT